MDYFKLLIFSLFLAVPAAQAGYAQLKPPPGWSQGMGAAVPAITSVPGKAGVFNFGAAANAGNFKVKAGTVLTNAALNVAGQVVTVPVSMRVAANAAVFAAEYSFGNPWLFVGVLAGTAIATHWSMQRLSIAGEGENAKWVKVVDGSLETCTVSMNGASAFADSCEAALRKFLDNSHTAIGELKETLHNSSNCLVAVRLAWHPCTP